MSSFYNHKSVFVTGGAGFIGSALVDRLIQLGAVVTVGDNLTTGNVNNLIRVWKKYDLKYKKVSNGISVDGDHSLIQLDFQELTPTIKAVKNHEIVFHLAANIGGRGYIDTHPGDCCEGFCINQNVIKAAHINRVERLLFASSACVYPQDLQSEYGSGYLLKETEAIKDNWANADREYGWAKLMGELTLQGYHNQYGLKGAITRYVTAYGPWENDTHAVIALIRRAVERQDPYVIWGSGRQDRDFTYLDDIVEGTLKACELETTANAYNLGTSKRYTMIETTNVIFSILGWRPKEIVFDTSKPEGVKTRALDISQAKQKLGWSPHITFEEGLKRTIDWFVGNRPTTVETIK